MRLQILRIFLKFSRNNYSILTVLKPLVGSCESTQQQQINLSLKLKGRETTNNYNALPKLNLLGEIEQKSPNLIQIEPPLPVTYNMIKLIYTLWFRCTENNTYILVHRTEVIKKTLNPNWKSFQLKVWICFQTCWPNLLNLEFLYFRSTLCLWF